MSKPTNVGEIRVTPITGSHGVSNTQSRINRDYNLNNIAIFFDTLDILSLQLHVCVCAGAILSRGAHVWLLNQLRLHCFVLLANFSFQ